MKRLLLALTLSTLPSTVLAQTVGDRAVGLGGAYVALADDLSALWYNPAGLVHIPERVFTASASAYQLKRLRIDGFMSFTADGAEMSDDFRSQSINVFPSTLVYGLRYGEDGIRHALAGGVLMPESDRAFGSVVFRTDGARFQRTFDSSGWSQDYHVGPGYAVGTTTLSAGVGALLRFHDREYGYHLFQDSPVRSGEPFITARVYSEQYRDLSLLPVIGVQWRPASWLQLGLVGILPAVKLWGEVEMSRVVTAAGAPEPQAGDKHIQVHLKKTSKTRLKTPLRALLGIAVLPTDWLTLEVTAAFSGGLDPHFDREVNLPKSAEIEHNMVQKEPGLDLRVGAEARLSEAYRLRVGAYTARSHHRGFGDQPLSRTAAGDLYYDTLGLNLGLGVYGDRRRSSYGINVVRGTGEALGFVTRPAGEQQPDADTPGLKSHARAVDLDVWQFTFLISGTLEGT